jgi:hypothetical protein
MTKTLLKFPSAIYLIAFRKFSKAKHWEINLTDLTVICDCSEKEALYACKDFRAVLMVAAEEHEPVTHITEFAITATAHRLTS